MCDEVFGQQVTRVVGRRSLAGGTAGGSDDQLALLVSLPSVAVTTLIAFNVIPASRPVVLAFGAGTLVLVRLGWRVASAIFDRERLITATT